jgi:HEAT repeat protein
MLRLMVRAATFWDDSILLREVVAATVVMVICTAAGWALGSAVLGAAVGLVVLLYGVVENLVERRRSAGDESSVDSDDEAVDYLKVLRARRDCDVETLIAALEDETDASLAADYLGEIGAVSAIPALVPLLEATDPHQRASAVVALGALKASTAGPRIMEIAEQDEVPWVRACAIGALEDLSCDSARLLLRALNDADIRVRRTAVVVLMNAGQPDAISALRAARKAEHRFSRRIYSKAIRRLERRSRHASSTTPS